MKIDSTGKPIKAKKIKVLGRMKTRAKGSEKRDYPKWREGMSTLDYVTAYHASNASVHLTEVTYTCQ
jgi:DUF2075 family protein